MMDMFSLEQLLAAPVQADIAGLRYELAAYLWRDFMPGRDDVGPDGGTAVMAALTVSVGFWQSSPRFGALPPFPADVDANYVFLIQGAEVWGSELAKGERKRGTLETRPLELQRWEPCLGTAGVGPTWKPGSRADVVVHLLDPTGAYLLRAVDVEIGRTD